MEEDEEKKLREEMAALSNGLPLGTPDVVDYPPNDYKYRNIDVGFVLCSVVTLLCDWVSRDLRRRD